MEVTLPDLATFPQQYRGAAGVYDELRNDKGEIRRSWRAFVTAVQGMGAAELARRWQHADRLIHDNGVTYHVFGDPADRVRPWELDLFPLILSAPEWRKMSAALRQRARLLDRIIGDVYGPQELLRGGLLPPEVVFAHPGFIRAFHDLNPLNVSNLPLYGAELARSPDGRWWVMADRLEAPAGPGYALENRIVLARTLPGVVHRCRIQRLAPFFIRFQEALKRLAPRQTESPRIVLLSTGPQNPYYFEDVYLARYLGYTLVEGSDLAVRDQRVFMKTLGGLLPVDVILSRGPEASIDPLELGGASSHGVPGLFQAIRSGQVALANRPGSALVESPVFMAFLPGLCQHLLGEELQMPSIATWWCGDPESLAYVQQRYSQLVIKPAFRRSGDREYVIDELSSEEAEQLRREILHRPHEFVAQEKIRRSSAPVWRQQELAVGHVALRTFLTADGDDFGVMPGGLIRVAPNAEPMQLSISAGQCSKDLWILADGPVEPISLLDRQERVVQLQRTGALLPSRVADNLFWLGRYLDRAETSARLIRVLLDRMASESEQEMPEVTALVRVLADQGQLEPGYAVAELHDQLPALSEALPAALFDAQEPHSLYYTVASIHRLGSIVRDWISADTWLAIHRLCETFDRDDGPRDDLTQLLETLDELLQNLASVSGMFTDGMIRGPAWRFFDTGRRIERTLCTTSLLRNALLTSPSVETSVLQALLDVMDCRMTYRSRYMANLRLPPILDLFLTDETNPRSIVFQMDALSQHVDALPGDRGNPLRPEEKRLVMKALHKLRMIDADELTTSDRAHFEPVLQEVELLVRNLADQLTRKYLVHSGLPRQLTEDEWR